ncbi:Os04g0112766 [Oryza sativa Japonica Group]|uniref:Os04g0112766 protein n=1 Tax=Oryza sativa subsp. japonica TaxID=39947 RepID=A0A0P0W6A5_ORYSJ|nr:Os04g0112766 [Oryza sativa Japonica Group]
MTSRKLYLFFPKQQIENLVSLGDIKIQSFLLPRTPHPWVWHNLLAPDPLGCCYFRIILFIGIMHVRIDMIDLLEILLSFWKPLFMQGYLLCEMG